MKLTDQQKHWIRTNWDVLDSIFRPDLEEMKEEIFTMADSKSRSLKIEFINKYQKLLTLFGLIKDSKESRPKSDI